MYRRKRRILKSLVLGLAVAAVAAPSALGEPRGTGNPLTVDGVRQVVGPDDRGLYRGGVPIESRMISADDRAVFRGVEVSNVPLTVPISSLSPDDRSLFRGVEVSNVPLTVPISSLSPDDRSLFRGVQTPNAPVIMVSSGDFQWSDAGLGAASTLAFVLLLGSASLAIRHQRRRIAAY
jgi:hypothetical protein